MKKLVMLSLLVVSVLGLTGCETYKKSSLTPDSFNYTFAVDHEGMKPAQHYFGLSWPLKNGE